MTLTDLKVNKLSQQQAKNASINNFNNSILPYKNPCGDNTSGLVLMLNARSGSGTQTTCTDESENNNNATLDYFSFSGDCWTGNSIKTNGTKDIIKTNTAITGDFTVCTKLKASIVIGGIGRLIALNGDDIAIFINASTEPAIKYLNTIVYATPSPIISGNSYVWEADVIKHLAIRRTAGSLDVMINGYKKYTTTNTYTNAITSIDFGNRRTDYLRPATAEYYNMCAYNRALSDTEIIKLADIALS